MLYETAVAWLSQRLVVTAPARDWEETVEGFGARLEAACAGRAQLERKAQRPGLGCKRNTG